MNTTLFLYRLVMPGFKRTRSTRTYSNSSSSSQNEPRKQTNTIGKGILSGTKIYIVQSKLTSPTITRLFNLAEIHTKKLCENVEEAEIVLTAIGMQKRLERHIPRESIKDKIILKPEWLEDSIKNGKQMPYDDYFALTVDRDDRASMEPDTTHPVTSSATNLDHTANFACQRASPLKCPNQDLVDEIKIIRRSRELDGNNRSHLVYSRAISAIKACPYRIETSEQASKLPYVGQKLQHKIGEYLSTGHISEAQTILKDEKYHILDLFTSIYGIGPKTAGTLYSKGCRTLEDLKDHYQVTLDLNNKIMWGRNEKSTAENWVDISLALRSDLEIKIPRKEVQEIHDKIKEELDLVQTGCKSIIVGGHRRGKPESNDVDIIFTHSDVTKMKDLCKRLTERLCDKGLVKYIMSMTGLNSTASSHSDVLDKSLVIFSPPGSNTSRRVDLIFAVPDVYWAAVVGWTGSTMFERDLRLYAKSKNLKFDSTGITDRRNEKLIVAHSEEEVFEILGLQWIDPTLRNADA